MARGGGPAPPRSPPRPYGLRRGNTRWAGRYGGASRARRGAPGGHRPPRTPATAPPCSADASRAPPVPGCGGGCAGAGARRRWRAAWWRWVADARLRAVRGACVAPSCPKSRTFHFLLHRHGPEDKSAAHAVCSPQARGWSHRHGDPYRRWVLLPAGAGMVPARIFRRMRLWAAPRRRGDGPLLVVIEEGRQICSPQARGWSPPGRDRDPRQPAAPRRRGDGPLRASRRARSRLCSPQARGRSLADHGRAVGALLLPAPAGMPPPVA